MAPRPAWKGYLKLSLVTCAVELTNATTQSEKVHFRIINRTTGNTVKRQYVDSSTGKPVKDEDEVKGYEIGDNEYLLVEENEIDAVEIEDDEQDRHEIEADVEFHARVVEGVEAAFIGGQLFRVRVPVGDDKGRGDERKADDHRDRDEDDDGQI